MIYKNLQIIGTSHVSKQSIVEVKEQIKEFKPNILALELDPQRFYSLISRKKRPLSVKDIKRMGLSGFTMNLIGTWIEKKIGKTVGVSPGAEMKAAALIARKEKIKIALIDQDVRITLKKLSKRVTLKEKLTFLKELLKTVIIRKPEIDIDLKKVPDQKTIDLVVSKVKKKYPSVYITLVKERNVIMAKNLYKIMTKNKKERIIAIVGAGHKQEIISLIKNEYSRA